MMHSDCHLDGVECVCSYCQCGFGNNNDHWQTVTVSGLDAGTYAVTTTSDDPIETPCCVFTDTVTLNFPPTPDPTASPSNEPSNAPSNAMTADPTSAPTTDPTVEPTVSPSNDPSLAPTVEPTVVPTASPTVDPTASPTY